MNSMFEDLLTILGEAIGNGQADPIPLSEDEKAIIADYDAFISPEPFVPEPLEEDYPYCQPKEVKQFMEYTQLTRTHLLRYMRVSEMTLIKFLNHYKIGEKPLKKITEDFYHLKNAYNKMRKIAS